MILVSLRWFKWNWWPAYPIAAAWTALVLRSQPCMCATDKEACPKHEQRFAVFSYLLGRSTRITFWLVVAFGLVIGVVQGISQGGS